MLDAESLYHRRRRQPLLWVDPVVILLSLKGIFLDSKALFCFSQQISGSRLSAGDMNVAIDETVSQGCISKLASPSAEFSTAHVEVRL